MVLNLGCLCYCSGRHPKFLMIKILDCRSTTVTDYLYPAKTPPCLTCVPPCFYCVSPCLSYVSVSPFVYCIHLLHVYIEALKLHSKSSLSCNSTTLQSLQLLTKIWGVCRCRSHWGDRHPIFISLN